MARTKSTFGKKTDSLISGFNALKRQRDQKKSAEEAVGNKEGVWRTVRGRHVFIEEGKTLEQALGHKPGVENQKKMDDPDKGLKKTSSEPYVRQAEKEAYRKKNPPMSAYEKMFQDLKRKNRKK